MLEFLRPTLFPNTGEGTYAIIDGAACEDLLPKLDEHQPEHFCLYAGDLAPDLEECAPYLVKLEPEEEFTRWLVDEGWDKFWSIFANSKTGLRGLRKHFRTFLQVKGPDNRTLYFRYYDPRVLRNYLPTCNAGELDTVFGPVGAYLTSSREPGTATRFALEDGKLSQHTLFPHKVKSPQHA